MIIMSDYSNYDKAQNHMSLRIELAAVAKVFGKDFSAFYHDIVLAPTTAVIGHSVRVVQ